GHLRVANLRWRGTAVANNLQSELRLKGGVLRLSEIFGNIAQGTFRSQLTYNLNDPERSFINLALDNVESSDLLAGVLGDKLKGPMQARIRGTLGSTWRGTVDLEMPRGELMGMEVTQWRMPASWQYSPASNRAQLEAAESSA